MDRDISLFTACLIAGLTGASFFGMNIAYDSWSTGKQPDAALRAGAVLLPKLFDQDDMPTLDCGLEVYSPVQDTCVSHAVFDAEMNRLFRALGLDPSIYKKPRQN